MPTNRQLRGNTESSIEPHFESADVVPVKRSYERHLPHQIPEKCPLFLTWNLKGAMSRKVWRMLQRERKRLEKQPERVGELPRDRKIRESKLVFALADRALDGATEGPMYLRDPAAAKIVESSVLFGVPERYDLFAWCVMSNHVHVLFTPRWELQEISQGIKGYTAHEINGLQSARGRVFWAANVRRSGFVEARTASVRL